jgi:hypothetical protein
MTIKDAAEFEKLLKAVADDTFLAVDYNNLSKALTEAEQEYWQEFAQTPTFWNLTRSAYDDVVLSLLARLYDTEHKALSLRTWLEVISAHAYLFDERNFRQRLKDNPFVKSLAQDARKPDPVQLDFDKKAVAQSDSIVSKLVFFRHKYLAHRDLSTVLSRTVPSQGQLTWADVDALIERATTIVNRYSYLFRAAVFSAKVSRHDDYKFILRAMRRCLE